MIESVVFDLDGTLLDTLEDLADAVNYGLRCEGLPERPLSDVRRFVGNGARRLIEQSVPEGAGDGEVGRVLARFREYYGAHCNDKTHPYDGILEMLRDLKKSGYAMAIVSNKPDSAVQELSRIHFGGLIGAAAGEREGTRRKPAPDAVFRALGEMGMPRGTAAYVGDSEVDVLTAKNAGLPGIFVLWGFRGRKELEACGASRFANVPAEVGGLLRDM